MNTMVKGSFVVRNSELRKVNIMHKISVSSWHLLNIIITKHNAKDHCVHLAPAEHSLMMLCYCVLHVFRHFLHWNCCVQRMCCAAVCCHLIVFCNSVSADRSGMAALRFIVAASACEILLRVVAKSRKCHIFKFWKLKEASHESFVFTHHGCDLNLRICTKHCVFSGKRSCGCGDK